MSFDLSQLKDAFIIHLYYGILAKGRNKLLHCSL